MSVAMIAIAGNGSLCRYGTREWYCDALLETLRKNEGLAPDSSMATMIEAGGEPAIVKSRAKRTSSGRKDNKET
jgi:hypothetical protein